MRTRQRLAICLLALVGCNCSSSSSAPAQQPGTVHAQPAIDVEPALAELDMVPADPREPMLAEIISTLLQSEHLRQRPIDDELSRLAFREYLKRLDNSKMFLLRSHADDLRRFEDRIDDQLRSGDLVLARAGAAMIAKRQAVVAGVVSEHLAKPFDFSVHEDLETDPDKLEFAATEAELADRWRKMLKLQVLERIDRMDETARALREAKQTTRTKKEDAAVSKPLEDIPPTFEGREQKAREELAKNFEARFARLAQVDAIEAATSLLNAVTTVYDPHTLYLPPADKADFDIQMSGKLEGIGALLAEEEHYIVVRELIPGGASWRQGKLEAGDLILAVTPSGGEAVDVADMPIDKVVQMIRGPKGTVVTLTVKKPDGKVEVINITRDVVLIEAAYARGAVLDLNGKKQPMGYIALPSFYGETGGRTAGAQRNAADDVKQLLGEFRKRKVGGVVLDLRANGGGLLEHARSITGLFIDKGPVVQTRYSNGEQQILEDEEAGVAFEGQVVVLVDRFSASASEIVAHALQDYQRAVIVGTGPTHGKGTVQVLIDLDRLRRGDKPLGVLKLTIQQFFGVKGESTQWRGVVPDVVLPDPIAHIETGERFLENSIEWSKVAAVPFTPWNLSSWSADTLAVKSKTRRAQRQAFAKIEARSALLKARREQTRMPLERQAWQARRELDRKALEEVDPKLDESPARFKVAVVDYDGNDAPTRDDGTSADDTDTWKDTLARDPWVEEALYILADMTAAKR